MLRVLFHRNDRMNRSRLTNLDRSTFEKEHTHCILHTGICTLQSLDEVNWIPYVFCVLKDFVQSLLLWLTIVFSTCHLLLALSVAFVIICRFSILFHLYAFTSPVGCFFSTSL